MQNEPTTERERMQDARIEYHWALANLIVFGIVAAIIVICMASRDGAPARTRAEKAEAALRECQRQHAPSRVESAARWLTSPKGGE